MLVPVPKESGSARLLLCVETPNWPRECTRARGLQRPQFAPERGERVTLRSGVERGLSAKVTF